MNTSTLHKISYIISMLVINSEWSLHKIKKLQHYRLLKFMNIMGFAHTNNSYTCVHGLFWSWKIEIYMKQLSQSIDRNNKGCFDLWVYLSMHSCTKSPISQNVSHCCDHVLPYVIYSGDSGHLWDSVLDARLSSCPLLRDCWYVSRVWLVAKIDYAMWPVTSQVKHMEATKREINSSSTLVVL